MSSKKTKAELVAENEDLLSRLAELEQNANPEPSMQSGMPPGRDTEQVMRNLLDVLPVSVIFFKKDGSISFTNACGVQMREAIVGGKEGVPLVYQSGTDEPYPLAKTWRAFTGDSTHADDIEVELSEGGRMSIEVWTAPFRRDDRDEVQQIVVVAADISARKAAEQGLRESEAVFRDLVETSQDLIWRIDEKGHFTYLNPAWEGALGYDVEEMLGRRFTDFKEPTEAIKPLEGYRSGWKLSGVNEFETTYISQSGDRLSLAFKAKSILDTAGGFIGAQGTAHDITNRQETEAELRLLSEVVKNMVGGVSLVRPGDRTIVFANPTFEKIFGYEPGELLGKSIVVLNAPGDATPEETSDAISRAIEENEWWQGELHNVKKDGTRFWTSAYVSELDHPQFGKVALSVVHDVTEQKQIENQLRQSQKIQALGTLAGGVAHDFNNILTPILGYSQILMEDVDSRDERAYASLIFHSAQRAKDLVSQILLFSRRDQTEQRIVDLCALTLELVEFVRSTLPKTIAIGCEISVTSAPVLCDSSQIYQVLVNLCVNAQQAIPGIGEIEIALGTVELDEFRCFVGKVLSGRYVRIAVTDNGIGMNEEVMGHLFEPFFTTKAVGEGTGLGLPIVFGIVQKHGGGIAVASEPGKGTTFEIFLPLVEDTIEKLPDTPDRIHDTGAETILFVDDEEAIRNLAKISLEQRLGYKVTIASDGQQALEIFSADPERFNLVVTDQTMPNMTGELLANELVKIRPDIPIILCTGYGTAISGESSQAIGISRFLYKPITPTELGRVVREVLDLAR